MTARQVSFVLLLVVIATATACNRETREAAGDKHNLVAITAIPPLSIDIAKTGSTTCSVTPQHPTISTSDQSQVYWHADDLSIGYQISLSWTCPSGSSGNSTITLLPNTVLGDSSPFTAQSCSSEYQAVYTVSMYNGSSYNQCSPAGTYIGIHVTQ